MTEHNHDAELTINNEEELLTLYDENGNEVLYRKMLEFYHPEFKRICRSCRRRCTIR